MSLTTKMSSFLRRFEIVLSIILFFAMLISCGLYINVKMNGLSATLPSLSETDKQILLRSDFSENLEFGDDIIEPLFVGFKRHNEMYAATPASASKVFVESAIYDAVIKLFSGSGEAVEFSSESEKYAFIDEIKNNENYILITFYCDMPSSIFLPCLVNNYNSYDITTAFNVRYLFILPDADGDIYGICISSDYDITLVTPSENVTFNKISEEAYDVSSGELSDFKYDDSLPIAPVLTSSFVADRYYIEPSTLIFGKDADSILVHSLFELFSINSNLVKSFTSGDESEINYVEEQYELTINDGGLVTYKSGEESAVSIDEYLGFNYTSKNNYSLADKIFALKSIINKLGDFNDTLFTIIGIDHSEEMSHLKVYFKYIIDGCIVTENKYDAVFEIVDDSLIFAEFSMLKYDKADEKSVVFPQIYANAVFSEEKNPALGSETIFCPMLAYDGNENLKKVKWSKMVISFQEVD